MSQEQIKQARSIRKRRMQERQAVIFGLLILLLAAIVLAAAGMYTGAISSPFAREFTYKAKPVDVQVPTPCLPNDTLPVASSKVNVQVLNASERGGLAAVVSDSLKERNFKVTGTGNAKTKRASVAVIFGVEGVAQGYTVAAHFPNAALILDEREGTGVDVELGQLFSSLLSTSDVPLEPETPMLTREGCVPMWELSDKAEAPEEPADPKSEDDKPADPDSEDDQPAEKPAEQG